MFSMQYNHWMRKFITPIQLIALALFFPLPGLAQSVPPTVTYRFLVLQSTAGSGLQFLGKGKMNASGQAVWHASFVDGEQSIFLGNGNSSTAIVSTLGTDFVELGDPDINDAGDVVFHGGERPASPQDPFTGIYFWQNGVALNRVLRAGDVVPDALIDPDKNIILTAFNTSPKINDSGFIMVPLQIFDGQVGGGSAFLDRIYLYAPTSENLIPLYEASNLHDVVVPGRPWDYASFALEAHVNNAERVAFWGTTRNPDGIIIDDGAIVRGGVDPASPFDSLPLDEIANNTGDLAALRSHMALNESGDVFYQARPNAGDPHDGLFIRRESTTTTVVAPDDPDITDLEDFALVVMNDAREVAFESSFPGFPNSLLVWNPTEGARRVYSATPADPELLDLADEPLRPGVALLGSEIYDIDEEGNLLLRLIFEDLTEMMVIGVVPIPDPTEPELIYENSFELNNLEIP